MRKFVAACAMTMCFAGLLYADNNGLAAYWDFDEGAGNIVYDSGGNGIDGSVEFAEWSKEGRYGGALYFTGNSMVNFGNNLNPGENSFSIEYWARHDEQSESFAGPHLRHRLRRNGMAIFQKHDVHNLGYLLWSGHSGTAQGDFFINSWDGDRQGVLGTVFKDIPSGTWIHFAVVVDREKDELVSYMDGAPVYSRPLHLEGPVANEAPFVLGHVDCGGVNYFTRGYIDDAAFWNRALSTEEIKRHAASSRPLGALLGLRSLSQQAFPGQPADKWDYAAMAYGRPWNFEDGTTAGIAEFGKGLKDVTVKNGCLTFNTGDKDNRFCWGPKQISRPVKDEVLHEEKIGAHWPVGANWYLQMRVKQSLPESTWMFYSPHGHRGHRKPGSTVTLKGTQWQTVTAYMGEVPLSINRAGSIEVSTEQPGNAVQIDWVKLVPAVSAHTHLRKTATLSSAPVKGDLYIRAAPNFKAWVNGKLVFSRGDRVKLNNYYHVDIAGFLHKGKNVIAVEEYSVGRGNAEGFIRCNDGSSTYLLIDSSWKRSYREEQNWTSPDFDDSGWSSARLKESSSMRQRWLNRQLANGNRYVGPIEVTGYSCPEPIFLESEPYNLAISVPDEKGATYTIDYIITGFESKQDVAQGVLAHFKQEEGVLKTELKCTIPAPGIYVVSLVLKDRNEIIDRRRLETAVVGRIKQREVAWNAPLEEGLELKLVDFIDCGKEDETREFADAPESKIVQTELGAVRQLHPTHKSWAGYRIKTGNAHKPHLIVVEYPGNVNMTIGCEIKEVCRKIVPEEVTRVSGGGYTGSPYPLTAETKKMQFIYFPNEDVVSIATVCNFNPKDKPPAQVKSIAVYEIENGLPAAKVLHPGNKLFGVQSERIGCARSSFFYDTRVKGERAEPSDREGYYAIWWKAVENFIRYMRFSGQNMYVLPAYMYHWLYYPSNEIPDRFEYQRDVIALFAKMFEANGMSLILNVEFFGTDNLYNQYVYTDEDVQKGAPTIFQVDRYGKQSARNWIGPVPNYSVPEVRDEVLTLVDELAQRYKDCPSIKGIGLIVDYAGWAPSYYEESFWHRDNTYSPIGYSYDDFSIAGFEKDTGIAVPGRPGDPARFKERFQFLTSSDIQDKWIQWRCDELLSLNKEIAGIIRKTGKNYYMVNFNTMNLPRLFNENITLEEIYRQQGYDIKQYKNIPGLVLCTKTDDAGYRIASIRYIRNKETVRQMMEINKSEQMQELFSGDGEYGRFVHLGFWEPCLGQPGTEKQWHVDGAWLGYTWAAAPYMLDSFTSQLAHSTPSLIMHTWTDGYIPTDNADLFRRFSAAYRSIPEGKYSTLAGNGLDTNIVIRQAQADNRTYVYLVNPQWWEAEIEIRLAAGTACKDLLTGKRYRRSIKTQLLPYDLRVFELTGRNAGFVSAVCTPSAEGKTFVGERLYQYRQKVFSAQTGMKEGQEAAVSLAAEMLKECERLAGSGDYHNALVLLDSIEMAKAAESLPASGAAAWMTMGPLDIKEDAEYMRSIEADAAKGEFSTVYRREGKRALRWAKMLRYEEDSALQNKGFTVFNRQFHTRTPFAAYAYTCIAAEKAGKARIFLGSEHRWENIKVWVNGNPVYEASGGEGKDERGRSFEAVLKEGVNHFVIKQERKEDPASFYFKLSGGDGSLLLYAVGIPPENK